ncbi:hypothetical protein [Nonomuraea sp. WAC 01424]|uniref:hypothetical protein n=1 Tax=Nonomuraea sp. WAC 01424 TaxID=2203200 RepID=UPI001C8BC44B|nr:hypothetical protein [Nonomuraea sp. WAC 01424]
MALRLLYLIFVQLAGRVVLQGRSQRSQDAEILVLRHQLAVFASAGGKAQAVVGGSGGDQRAGAAAVCSCS